MRFVLLLCLCLIPVVLQAGPDGSAGGARPEYSAGGLLLPPQHYREWIYLTSGFDMSYSPQTVAMNGQATSQTHSIFDNVFVNPEAYRSFLHTGTWPDKTVLVLEERGAEANNSINKAGRSQSPDLMGIEVHVKDAAHGGWAFYVMDGDKPAEQVPAEAACYSCHRDHAAVDTTFVQFYPTLLPLSTKKGTLSANYRQEQAQPSK